MKKKKHRSGYFLTSNSDRLLGMVFTDIIPYNENYSRHEFKITFKQFTEDFYDRLKESGDIYHLPKDIFVAKVIVSFE